MLQLFSINFVEKQNNDPIFLCYDNRMSDAMCLPKLVWGGTTFGKGGPLLAAKSGLRGPVLVAKSGPGDHLGGDTFGMTGHLVICSRFESNGAKINSVNVHNYYVSVLDPGLFEGRG